MFGAENEEIVEWHQLYSQLCLAFMHLQPHGAHESFFNTLIIIGWKIEQNAPYKLDNHPKYWGVRHVGLTHRAQ